MTVQQHSENEWTAGVPVKGQKLSVFHGEPGFWSGSYGTRPNPAPVYGLAKGRDGVDIDLDQEVLVHSGMGLTPLRATIVGIGDAGLPDQHTVKIRPYKSAHITGASSAACEPHSFDEYEWLKAETEAATLLGKRNIDLARTIFGGFYFDLFQRHAMECYLANRAALAKAISK